MIFIACLIYVYSYGPNPSKQILCLESEINTILVNENITSVAYLLRKIHIQHVLVMPTAISMGRNIPVFWLMPLVFVSGFHEFHNLDGHPLTNSIKD